MQTIIRLIITRTRLFLPLTLWLAWALAAQAATTPDFSASTSGTNGRPTITASLQLADADAGQQGSVYLAAYTQGGWFAHDGARWQLWQGGALPAYASGMLTNRSIEVVRDLDAAAFAGTQIYLGYGRHEADMLANHKYALVHTVSAPIDEARSNLPRSSSTAPSTADQQVLSAGNQAFALELYRQLSNDPQRRSDNLFLSPLSISMAMAMTYTGARGSTADEMASALRFTLPQDRLHPAFGWLDLQLESRGLGAQGKDGQPFRLTVSNSLWGERQASFAAPFLDTLAQHYGAGIKLLDFIASPDPSRLRINDWVAQRTEQRIRNLLPDGSISSDTRLVLVNAVYFNAAWQHQFNATATADAAFTRLDGTTATVALMNQTEHFNYAEGSGYQAVELPYDGGELSMLVLLPAAGQFLAFEQTLDTTRFAEIQAALRSSYVRLGLPKFKLEGGFSVKTALQALGMNAAFGDAADFSGISTNAGWRIFDIYHKGYADVDERGTEAAAATGVVVGVTSVPPEPVVFRADRPFLFAIVDRPTNTLVFLGRFVAP